MIPMVKLKLKELGDAIANTEKKIATMPTETLLDNLDKMAGWRDAAKDRLEKMAFADLVTLTKKELKKRGIKH